MLRQSEVTFEDAIEVMGGQPAVIDCIWVKAAKCLPLGRKASTRTFPRPHNRISELGAL